MKTVHLKLFSTKNCFILLVLIYTLFLLSFFYKRNTPSKIIRPPKENNVYLVPVPVNHTKDAIEEFKSKLYPFKSIKNPCWIEPPPFFENMLTQMKMVWRQQIFSKEIPTANIAEVFVQIQTARLLERMSKFRCFPYFYIMSSCNCIRDEIVNSLIEHPKIIAPSKIDIDFWPNVQTNDIEIYANYFETPTNLISQDEFILTFDASSSTLFQPNFLFQSKGDQYSTADFIHAFNKNVKILVFLQDPVTKVYTDYLAKKNKSSPSQFHQNVKHSIMMFNKCVQVYKLKECIYNKNFTQTYPVSLHLGIYWVFLEKWCRKFSTKQMKMFNIEDYLDQDEQLMEHIYEFILQSHVDVSKNNTKFIDNCLHPGLSMLNETEVILREFYNPYNKKLVKVTGNRDLMWP